MKRVLVFGTFDLLHRGHLSFLRQARKKGRWLIAAVARDDFVKETKMRDPVHHEGERIARLLRTGLVNEAYLSDEQVGSYRVVERSRPDIICFGHDQELLKQHLTRWLDEHGDALAVGPETFTLKAHRPHRYKSSKMMPVRPNRS